MDTERVEVIHLTDDPDKLVFHNVRLMPSGWLSCRLAGSDRRTRIPAHRVERVVSKPASEVSHDD